MKKTKAIKEISDLKAGLNIKKNIFDQAKKFVEDLQANFQSRVEEELTLGKNKEMKVAALKTLEATLNQVGQAAAKMSDNAFSIAAEIRKEKLKYLDKIFEKEDQEFQEKAKQAQYQVQIQCFQSDEQALDVACASLFLAVGALKKVYTVLIKASEFWEAMQMACEDLSKLKFAGKLTPESQAKLKNDIIFKKQLYQYYVGWKALEVILKEYSAKTAEIKNKVWKDFEENLSVEKSRQKAKELSVELVNWQKEELSKSNQKMEMIKEARKKELAA